MPNQTQAALWNTTPAHRHFEKPPSDCPITGRHLPHFPNNPPIPKQGEFAFDAHSKPTSNVFNTLDIGNNIKKTQTRRIATDVVYRRSFKNALNVHGIDNSEYFDWGRYGSGSPLLASNGQIITKRRKGLTSELGI